MGRLRTVSLILVLGAWGGATAGAAPDDAAAAPSTATRQAPPAPAIKYLEAGARLFNDRNFAMASKYLEAANRYRSDLREDEQKTLDAYLGELAKVKQEGLMAPSASSAPAAAPVAAAAAPVTAAAAPVTAAAAPVTAAASAVPVSAAPAPANAAEAKQRGRWLLKEGREKLILGNYDAAQQKSDEARSLDIRWGLFDDTPDKLDQDIARARPRAALPSHDVANANLPHDRRTARARLRDARKMLDYGQFEQAEAVALDVKGWGLSYSMFEDSPEKVAAAARALRRRDKVRRTPAGQQMGQGVYEELVLTSRQLLKAGRIDEAEKKAQQALSMHVYPGLNQDRAEDVLHDIEMARHAPPAPAPTEGLALAQAEAAPAGIPVAGGTEKSTVDPAVIPSSAPAEAAPELSAPADRAPSSPPVMAAAPALDAAPAPAAEAPMPAPAAQPTAAPTAAPAGNRGEQLIAEAKALFASGNFRAAREIAGQAKTANTGVDSQADELIAQIGLAEQGGALALYEEALASIRKGDANRARALLTEVAAAGDSLDQGLRTKVQGLLQKLASSAGQKPGTASTVDAAQDAETIAAQKLNAEVGTKIAEARRYHETDPDKALGIYQKSIQAVQGSGLPPELTRPMVRRLEVATELAKKDKAVYLTKMSDKKQRDELELKRLRILEADGAKKGRVNDLMQKAAEEMAAGKYIEAEANAKRVMEIDPNNEVAPIVAFKARMERRFKSEGDIRDAKENGVVETLLDLDKSSIPADKQLLSRSIKYAESFKDLTRDRLALMKRLEDKEDPKVVSIKAKLKEPISLNIDKQPLNEALKFISDYSGLNIVPDARGLADEGLAPNSPVSLTVNNISMRSALSLLLKPLGLTYKIENEVILITSPQANPTDTYVKTYYVGDLLIPPSRSVSEVMPKGWHNVDGTNSESSARMVSPNSPYAMGVQGPEFGSSGTQVIKSDRRWVDMSPLVQLIATSIAPGTWQVNDPNGTDISQSYGLGGAFGGDQGGDNTQTRPPGAITPFFLSISLIIRHTAQVHDQVADLLRQLRRLQDLQVSIEVRFITVQDNFFEQIGVGFDFQINSNAVGRHSTFAVPSFTGFPLITPGTPGLGLLGGGLSGGSSGGSSGGGLSGGSSGGSSGGGGLSGGSSGGGSSGGGSSGGASGGSSGGSASGGASGGSSGGSASGGASGGSSGGSSGGGAQQITPYIVNPIRDHVYPSSGPLVVGTQGAGLANFSPNLALPFTNTDPGLIAPSFVNNYQPNAGGTFGIAFLSDLEVYLFLTAAQGDTRSNVLSAPKVTTFNGASATIISGTLQYYVASLTPIIGPGSVAYTPNVSAINSGVFLMVTPVVSADRRYVRMTLSPNFNSVNGFTTYSSQIAGVGGSGLGGGAATIQGQIQLPNTTTNTISTTVTVPDGGTVLMGGVKTMIEQRIEYGVPILSKTPMIDRLFRNVGIGRNSQSLMIMVSPHIIILEEEEERLGIPAVAM